MLVLYCDFVCFNVVCWRLMMWFVYVMLVFSEFFEILFRCGCFNCRLLISTRLRKLIFVFVVFILLCNDVNFKLLSNRFVMLKFFVKLLMLVEIFKLLWWICIMDLFSFFIDISKSSLSRFFARNFRFDFDIVSFLVILGVNFNLFICKLFSCMCFENVGNVFLIFSSFSLRGCVNLFLIRVRFLRWRWRWLGVFVVFILFIYVVILVLFSMRLVFVLVIFGLLSAMVCLIVVVLSCFFKGWNFVVIDVFILSIGVLMFVIILFCVIVKCFLYLLFLIVKLVLRIGFDNVLINVFDTFVGEDGYMWLSYGSFLFWDNFLVILRKLRLILVFLILYVLGLNNVLGLIEIWSEFCNFLLFIGIVLVLWSENLFFLIFVVNIVLVDLKGMWLYVVIVFLFMVFLIVFLF